MDISYFMTEAARKFLEKRSHRDFVDVVDDMTNAEVEELHQSMVTLNTAAVGAVIFKALARQYENQIVHIAEIEREGYLEAMREDFEDIKRAA